MQSSSSALGLLHLIHKNYADITDEECIISLSLNDSIAKMIFHADYDSAIANSRETLARFPRSPYLYFTARHLALIGRCLTLSGSFAPGEEALHRALQKAKPLMDESRESIKFLADILHDLAMNNDMSQGTPETSMRYLEKALRVLDGTDIQVRKGVCLMGLGNINYNSGGVGPALEYYLKAAVIFEEESNLSNLANVCSNIGLCFTDLGKMKLAESHLTRSLHLRRNLGNPDQIAVSYHNLSRLYDKMGDTEKALIHMLACRDSSRGSVNKHVYSVALEWIENCPLRESDLEDSTLPYQYGLKLQLA
jgi:tetratricopeptide (TPR) repeat protein